ncbi:hypothetical protein EV383_3625 [Pseudonocardia sediminis]|uniref:Roadblock/LAMTOR2 domain-containing protein n=1 Tax=Pseudonocardia sediminis TaxID=1397368 RepID=A0A4Q7UXE0_PSEST|nr:roadblock/LC7 domain-containing protein [Pseudonocardia sediminis]RZT86727.1 hypothetical protein EV383_3625 [Pseudonocardia sediminis]
MTAPEQDVDRLVTDFVERVPGVAHAVVVAADGLPAARSAEVPDGRAEQIAAITSGLSALTAGASRVFHGGQVGRTVVEMHHGTVIVTAIGHGAALAVLTAPQYDRELVREESARLGGRVGRGITATSRPAGPGSRRTGVALTGVLARALSAEVEKGARPGDEARCWFARPGRADVYGRDSDTVEGDV